MFEIYVGVTGIYYLYKFTHDPRHRGEAVVYSILWPFFLTLDLVFSEPGLRCIGAVAELISKPVRRLNELLAPN